MLEKWRRAKSFIQMHLVEFLGKRRHVIEGILREFKAFQMEAVRSKGKLALETVTDEIRIDEIVYQIKRRVKQYLAELKAQSQAINWLKEAVKKACKKAKFDHSFAFDSSSLPFVPPKPVLRLDFTREDFETILGQIAGRKHSTSTTVSHKKKPKRHSIQPVNRNRGQSKHEKFPS